MLPTALEQFAEATGELGVADPAFRAAVFHHKKISKQPGLWSMKLKVIPTAQTGSSASPKGAGLSAAPPESQPSAGNKLVSVISGQLSTQLANAQLAGMASSPVFQTFDTSHMNFKSPPNSAWRVCAQRGRGPCTQRWGSRRTAVSRGWACVSEFRPTQLAGGARAACRFGVSLW
jgi:hypothetical protein